MASHFIRLYLLVVLAIAAVSWAQERLWLAYSNQNNAADASLAALFGVVENELRAAQLEQRGAMLARLADESKLGMELLARNEITGDETLAKLDRGEIAFMEAGGNESWLMQQIDAQTVLALQYRETERTRGPLEWALALLLYAVIALAVMLWVWPLTRDLRRLEIAIGCSAPTSVSARRCIRWPRRFARWLRASTDSSHRTKICPTRSRMK